MCSDKWRFHFRLGELVGDSNEFVEIVVVVTQ